MMRSIPVGAPQPWPPPPSLTFCSPGICSLNCPQWCGSLFFPPPPPFLLDPSNNDDDDNSSHISPLMAALIAVLAAAFLVLFYYTVLSRFFRRRTRRRRTNQILNNVDDESDIRIDPMVVHDPDRPGLDDSFIRQITVFKYRQNDGLIDGSDCAVCLSEFKEEENLRLMPNCEHAFHIPCIDTWLKSHSSCPLCRATMNPAPTRTNDPNLGVSLAALQVQRRNDVVLVVREVEERGGEVIECHDVDDSSEKIDRR